MDIKSGFDDIKIAIVLPSYNEEQYIAEVLGELKRYPGLFTVVVDDGSTDKTIERAEGLADHIIKHERNYGKGRTIYDGCQWALSHDYAAVILMDSDGQHAPSDIPQLISAFKNSGADIVLGNRLHEPEGMSFVRLVTNKFMSWVISCVSGQHIPDSQCGFRLMSKRALHVCKIKTSNFEIESEIIIEAARGNLKIISTPVKSIYRDETSQINPIHDTMRFMKFILRELNRK